jgi:hypothetical protein
LPCHPIRFITALFSARYPDTPTARKNLTAYFEIVRSVLFEVAHTGDYALGDALSADRARQPA